MQRILYRIVRPRLLICRTFFSFRQIFEGKIVRLPDLHEELCICLVVLKAELRTAILSKSLPPYGVGHSEVKYELREPLVRRCRMALPLAKSSRARCRPVWKLFLLALPLFGVSLTGCNNTCFICAVGHPRGRHAGNLHPRASRHPRRSHDRAAPGVIM